MTTKVKVKKEHVVAIMKESGWHDVDEKGKEWFEDKLQHLKDALPEDYSPEDEEVQQTLHTIFEEINDAENESRDPEFEVEGEWPSLPGEDNKEEKKKGRKKKEKGEKAEKKPKKKKKSRVLTRGFYAGVVFKKHGRANGITEEMIKDVDELYGTPNADVSKGALKWAEDALKGYFDGDAVMEEAKKEPAEEE